MRLGAGSGGDKASNTVLRRRRRGVHQGISLAGKGPVSLKTIAQEKWAGA